MNFLALVAPSMGIKHSSHMFALVVPSVGIMHSSCKCGTLMKAVNPTERSTTLAARISSDL